MGRKRIITAIFEVFLIVSLSFSLSFMLKEGSRSEYVNGNTREKGTLEYFLPMYESIVRSIFSDNLVSAVEPEAYTCVKGKDGSICQEFPVLTEEDVEECNDQCDGECIPSPRKEVSECKIGTCYDNIEGTCQAGSPKASCEGNGGNWFDDPYENIPQCKEGCCILGDQAMFVSEGQCSRQAELAGLEKDFRAEVNTELACLALANTQEEGACVISSDVSGDKNDCRFTTRANCLEIEGDFNPGLLCSNPELNTRCEKQASAQCVEGKDELYWFDSCGNRENIYDANKVKSWNEGEVLTKGESCDLGNSRDALANQNTCGNCNYLLGSICGDKTSEEKLSDGSIDFVCRDLRCVDSSGQLRENGESWCEYNSQIGIDDGSGRGKDGDLLTRAVDTPGSRHFRKVCFDGEVRTEACADYRNEICVESQTEKKEGGTFSSAACRINRWQQCLEYNTQEGATTEEGQEERDNQCGENPDCFVKGVNVDDNFAFNLCAPRYPPGFNLDSNGESAESICSLASQTCKVVYVKKLSGWKCVANCDCEDKDFAEQMNDLCISLGDCGAGVNYQGELTERGYDVKNSPKLSGSYLDELERYSNPKEGQYAKPGDLDKFYGSLGIPGALGKADTPEDRSKAATAMALATAGGIGVSLLALGHLAPFEFGAVGLGASNIFGSLGLGSLAGEGSIYTGSELSSIGQAGYPGITQTSIGLGGALAGAAIGLAATSLLIKFLGIGPGLGQAETFGLVAAGTVGSAIVGYNIAVGQGFIGEGFLGGFLGPGLVIGVIALIIAFKLLGIGETKEVIVEFSCEPWQAPLGGESCEECGEDGLPCSEYACNSLGQTCEFVNEGTDEELCVNVNPNDVIPPKIEPLESALSDNYEYSNVNERGFKLENSENDGCVRAYENVAFGLKLDEPGQCKFDTEHTNSFEEMEFDLGQSSLFRYNHTQTLLIPSLDSLGLPGYDPNRRTDYNLYVRCQDKTGNSNIQEYVIDICVRPGEDKTAPSITGHSPESEFVKYNSTEQEISIYTNEPSECKWDSVDREYDSMSNDFTCENDLTDRTLLGWSCSGIAPISENETKVYVRCQDQPWLDEERGKIIVDEGTDEAGRKSSREIGAPSGSERNENQESYVITYKRSESELKIDSITPNENTLEFGTVPASLEVVVKTSGGVDGNARCSYSFGDDRYTDFFDTLGDTHGQFFQSLFSGDYEIFVKCEDSAGNTAKDKAQFAIKLDDSPPEVTRIYDAEGELTIVTDEDSQCGFVTGIGRRNECRFNLDDSNTTLMSGGGLTHTSNFERVGTYYVKCRDKFGNIPGSCSAIIKGG